MTLRFPPSLFRSHYSSKDDQLNLRACDAFEYDAGSLFGPGVEVATISTEWDLVCGK